MLAAKRNIVVRVVYQRRQWIQYRFLLLLPVPFLNVHYAGNQMACYSQDGILKRELLFYAE